MGALIKIIIIIASTLPCLGCSLLHPKTTLESKISASARLNPDINNRASPILLGIYELKSSIPFKSLDYYQISSTSHKKLASSLIDFNELEIRPSENKYYKQVLNPNTHYLGLIAAYRNIENAQWKKIIEIPRGTYKLKLKIYLNSQQLSYQILR